MMTFLPYPDFTESAAVLDVRRLGKQRVEVLQILLVMERGAGAWTRHPAVLMWRPFREALVSYGVAVTREWLKRGYRDTCLAKIAAFAGGEARSQDELRGRGMLPAWLDDRRFWSSHRSSLVRKAPEYYRRFFPGVPDDLPYFWPTREEPYRAMYYDAGS